MAIHQKLLVHNPKRQRTAALQDADALLKAARMPARFWTPAVLTALWELCLNPLTLRASETIQTEANVMAEISFTAKKHRADPFNEITLDVIFSEPNVRTLSVPAFWAGGDTWKARYASPLAGKHLYRTECNVKTDSGLHGREGSLEIVPYRGQNPFY